MVIKADQSRCNLFQVLNIIQIAVIQRILARLTREICFSELFDKICMEEITIIVHNNCYHNIKCTESRFFRLIINDAALKF